MGRKSRHAAQSGRGYQLRGQACILPVHDSSSHPSGPQAPNQPSWRLRVRVGRTRKENPTTCSRHRGTPGTVGSVHAKYEQGYIASRALCLSAKLCPVLQIQALCSMKLTAVGASVQEPFTDGRTPPRAASARRIQPKRGCEKMGSQSAVACPEATAKGSWPSATDHGQSQPV